MSQDKRLAKTLEQPELPLGPAASARQEILQRASMCVTKDRQQAYGGAEDNFRRIAALWNALKGEDLFTAHDVAAMMIAVKLSRIAVNPTHEDSWVDAAGYAACGGGLAVQYNNPPDITKPSREENPC